MTGRKGQLRNLREIEEPTAVLGFKDQFVSVPQVMGDLDIVTLNFENKPCMLALSEVRLDEKMNISLFYEGPILDSGCRGDSWSSYTIFCAKAITCLLWSR